MTTLSASLVLYNNPSYMFERVIECFLASSVEGQLVIVDNSPVQLSHVLFEHHRVRYIAVPGNLGFGGGHNHALAVIGESSAVGHLFLNPDVDFGPDVLPTLLTAIEQDPTLAAIMPQIINPDGTPQPLAKLLPTPFDLVLRRFIPLPSLRRRRERIYELHGLPLDRPTEVPTLSGCFLLVRSAALALTGGFDTRYFMYMEDVDLIRRIADYGRVMFEPRVIVRHGYGKGSYRDLNLLRHHVRSATRYFIKWGWIFDPVRRSRNRTALMRLRTAGTTIPK
jgi:GT2 family glycosyltransferase